MNKVMLIGNLCFDFELKHTKNDKVYTKNTIAVKERFDKDKSNFIRIVLWNKTAEVAHKYLSKGDKIALVGTVKTGSYVDNAGTTKYTWDVWVEELHFVNTKPKTNNNNDNSEDYYPLESEDELPF